MYKEQLKAVFAESRIKAVVYDVFVVPDYKDWLHHHIDSAFGNCHKTVETQHQWSFEKVNASVHFPLGVKTMYRAYAQDSAIEIIKSIFPHENECGRLVGLKAVQVAVYWYPIGDPSR